ncbi:helix-turn-helix domain-containing protein [Sphingomonas flavalba]|uniref:helix-turn-helix domain-containing protein n=1 Tax=Sphingomonas flavalba TaxID=2559804 RepID=UPI0039DF600C
MADLPNRIREQRRALHWKQQDLAERVNCSIAQISDLERGARELSYAWMVRIARALDVEPADLLLPEHNSGSLTSAERALVERYRAGSDDQKRQIEQMSDIIVPFVPETPRKRAGAA